MCQRSTGRTYLPCRPTALSSQFHHERFGSSLIPHDIPRVSIPEMSFQSCRQNSMGRVPFNPPPHDSHRKQGCVFETQCFKSQHSHAANRNGQARMALSFCLLGYLPLPPLRLCGETQEPGQQPGPPKEGFSPRRQARKGWSQTRKGLWYYWSPNRRQAPGATPGRMLANRVPESVLESCTRFIPIE